MQEKKFAVIGHPIGHTMSPFIHRRLLELAGVHGTYGKMDIPPEELTARFADTLKLLDGFNVTIPHKQAVVPLLDCVDGDAAAFGSVNTVAVCSGKTNGYTTDGIGFTRALAAAGIPLTGRVLLLGSGGVARVFANEILRAPGVTGLTVAMHQHDDERLNLPGLTPAEKEARLRRSQTRCDAFAAGLDPAGLAAFRQRGGRDFHITGLEQIESENAMRQPPCFDLLVNGTSAGMYPRLSCSPVSKEVVARCGAVFDAVYNPGVTQLMHDARELHLPCAGGMGMLVWQAAAAEEIWLGCHFAPERVAPIVADAAQAMRLQFGNIVLCGFMGCGKSTVGRLIAQSLHRELVDTDRFLELQTGLSVPEMFRQHGEAWFRKQEAEACRVLSRRSGLVISTGGGALVQPENAAVLQETGVVALLMPPYAVLEQRLSKDHSRPLLECPNRTEVMRRLYDERLPHYQAAADLTIHAETSAAAAQTLLALLSGDTHGLAF